MASLLLTLFPHAPSRPYLFAHRSVRLEIRPVPLWAQHASFMDRLFENGMVVLGGPFADATGSWVIVEAENEHEVADVFAHDPFVVHDIFSLSNLKQWLLFLDARHS